MDVVSDYRYTKLHASDGGEGQNSIGVFRAFDLQLRTEVAVKEIDKNQFRDPQDFFREAQQMFRSAHPNVVAIRTATQQADRVCLVMPLYSRGSLAKRIEVNPLSLTEAVKFGRHMLAGVGAIHAADTVHFDIKPSNVLFSDEDMAMIADFGQARDVGPAGVTLMPNRMYGTMVPPEAFTNRRRGTFESDVYQVGLTLWRACNGKQLYETQLTKHGGQLRQKIIEGRFPQRDLYLPHIPDRLRRAIRKALRVEPAERFPSARDFANAISGVDVAYDWRVLQLPEGEYTWLGAKEGAAALKVTLTKDNGAWNVSLYTRSSPTDRRTRTAMWRRGLSRKKAMTYLRQLFATLG